MAWELVDKTHVIKGQETRKDAWLGNRVPLVAFNKTEIEYIDSQFEKAKDQDFDFWHSLDLRKIKNFQKALLKAGYEIIGTEVDIYKQRGCVDIHTDEGTPIDVFEVAAERDDESNVNDYFNFAYVYKMDSSLPKTTETTDISVNYAGFHEGLDFIYGAFKRDLRDRPFPALTDTPLLIKKGVRTGQLILFDARYEHGIMTDHAYYLLLGIVKKIKEQA